MDILRQTIQRPFSRFWSTWRASDRRAHKMEMFRWTVYLMVPFIFYKVATADNLRSFVKATGVGKVYEGVNGQVAELERLREETRDDRQKRKRERDERLQKRAQDRTQQSVTS